MIETSDDVFHGSVTSNLLKDIASFEAIAEDDNIRSRQRRDSAIKDDQAKLSKSNYSHTVKNLNKYYQLG